VIAGGLRELPARLRRRAILEADVRRLRREHGDAFRAHDSASGRVALIVSLTEFVYQLKLEGLLGAALRQHGLRPLVLVQPGSWIPRKYFESFGITDLVELGDYLTEDMEREAEREAAKILGGRPTFAELRGLTFRGAAIGRNVLATVSRALHEGAVDLGEPRIRAKLAELLPRTLAATLAAERLLDDLGPELVLFLERNYAAEAPISEVALVRGANVVQFISGPRNDTLVCKRFTRETRRVHPRSLSDESWQRVQRMPWTGEHDRALDEDFEHLYGSVSAPRDDLLRALGLDPGKKTAVVYSHILWDANMFYGEDLFSDQHEWFVATLRAAAANDRVNWIVKLHPANRWKRRREGMEGPSDEEKAIREVLGKLPPHIALLQPESEISTGSIFGLTDVGITIRGSVGYELPCFGVPVLTAGTGFYSGLGFTVDSASAADYLARLEAVERTFPLRPEQVELARRHAYALFRLRPMRFSSFTAERRPLPEMGHPLDHDIELHLRTREDFESAKDLRRFAGWATGSRELDYLELEGVSTVPLSVLGDRPGPS
jgi:hypothetical protein